MSLSIGSVFSGTQAAYTSQLYRGIDRNYDNTYSKQEVSNFASEYEKSTGASIDVDAVFEKYDTDLDGSFSAAEYKAVQSDDALGMKQLLGTKTETDTTAKPEDASNEAASWLSSLSGRAKNSLVQSTFRAESTGNLLSAMFGNGGIFASLNSRNAVQQYSMFSAAQSLGTLSSSFNILL